jgi:DNA-binding PadR family transcriptional regulator
MEHAGLIRTRRERSEDATGRPRRFVAVTQEGLALLDHSRRVRLRMWQGIETILERG